MGCWAVRSCAPYAVTLGGGQAGILLTGSGARERRWLQRDHTAAGGIEVRGQLSVGACQPLVILGTYSICRAGP